MRLLALFGILSLAAVTIGTVVASASAVPPGVWLRNPAAWVVGAIGAAAVAVFAGRRTALGFVALAPVGLAASLVSADQLGVHRWVEVGPLHVNVGQVLLPPAIVAAVSLTRAWAWWGWATVVLLLLVLQPDASQATAFGGALIAMILLKRSLSLPVAGVAVVAAAVIVSWLRPDPLAPVPEVEEIMRLAWAFSPPLAVAAWIALVATCASLVPARASDARPGIALSLYAGLTILMPLFGPFPVPLVGMAVSPIIGLWLGAGLATALRTRDISAYRPAGRAG